MIIISTNIFTTAIINTTTTTTTTTTSFGIATSVNIHMTFDLGSRQLLGERIALYRSP